MIDNNKVIKGLECCAVPGGNCEECPYQHSGVGEYFESKCVSKLSADALALLKAQNAADNLDAAIRLVREVTEDVRKNYE